MIARIAPFGFHRCGRCGRCGRLTPDDYVRMARSYQRVALLITVGELMAWRVL